MAYTNVELLRHTLTTPVPIQEKVTDQAVILGSDYVTFFNGPVEHASVTVKSIQSTSPVRTTLTLTHQRTSIVAAPLVRGSVVVASDSSLGSLYTENVDYIVDYTEGDVLIKEGGSLALGQTVTVWYVAYITYQEGSDYLLDATNGRLKRTAGGDIAVGETVWLDYQPVYASIDEELLTKAVTEANGLIEREVDPDGQFGADPTLQASATYRALEIVCHAAAARELSSLRGEDRTALAWIRLAEKYAARSERLLRSFRAPYANPNAPTHG